MLAYKLDSIKEAIESAQTAVSSQLPSSDDTNKILSFLSDALAFLLQSINDFSLEKELIYLSIVMTYVCWAIRNLARSPDLSRVNISGVSFNSMLDDLKNTEEAVKTAKSFAMISEDLQDPDKLDHILNAGKIADGCIATFSFIVKECKEKESIIELSSALKNICTAINCSASKVALKYACDYE